MSHDRGICRKSTAAALCPSRHAFSPPTYALITPAPVVVEIHVSFVRSFPPLSLLSFFHISTFAVSLIRQFVASPQEPRPEREGEYLLVGRGGEKAREGWKCEFPSQNPFSRVKCGIRGMRRQNIWRRRQRGLISGSVDGIGGGEGEMVWVGVIFDAADA